MKPTNINRNIVWKDEADQVWVLSFIAPTARTRHRWLLRKLKQRPGEAVEVGKKELEEMTGQLDLFSKPAQP